MAHDPRLVVLDEPTADLDPQAHRELWETVTQLRADGASVLLTTNSLEQATAPNDRIALMDRGDIVAEGTARRIVEHFANDPRVEAASQGPVTLEDVFVALTARVVRRDALPDADVSPWQQERGAKR